MRTRLFAVAVLVLVMGQCAMEVHAATDLYRLLGVLRDATDRQIKKAYHKLSLMYHPDKNPGEEAENKFMEIASAYEILSDPDKRREYDNGGRATESEAQREKNTDRGPEPVDILLQGTGGTFAFRYRPPPKYKVKKGGDISATATVSLLEVYNGTVKNVTYTRQEVCPVCNGTGAEEHHHVLACPKCFGSGFRLSFKENGEGFRQQYNTTCHECEGTGKYIEKKCPRCDGQTIIFDRKEKIIEVPRGAPAGHSWTFTGEGDCGPGLEPGNLKIALTVEDHPIFQREGDNLLYSVNITLFEALLGFTTNVTSVDNRTVRVVHDAVSQPGGHIIVPREGMPKLNGEDEEDKGNLVVMLDIEFPKSLNEDEKQLLRSVLDEEAIKALEEMLKRRATQEILARMREPLGHTLGQAAVIEQSTNVNVVDEHLEILFPGRVEEWRFHATQAGPLTFLVYRPSDPSDPSVPAFSYTLIGRSLLMVESAGTFHQPLDEKELIPVLPGDLLGFRLEAPGVMSYNPHGPGWVRMSAPGPSAKLGELREHLSAFNRTYPFQGKIRAAVVLFSEVGCRGKMFMPKTDDADLCQAQWDNGGGGAVKDHAVAMLVPGGHHIKCYNQCNAPPHSQTQMEVDHRQVADSTCIDLPPGVSMVRLAK